MKGRYRVGVDAESGAAWRTCDDAATMLELARCLAAREGRAVVVSDRRTRRLLQVDEAGVVTELPGDLALAVPEEGD